jgi:hypothetical protein
MSKSADNRDTKQAAVGGKTITKSDYLSLAAFLRSRAKLQRIQKRDPNGEAVQAAADQYEDREFVAAYESFKPAYDRVVTDMQRVLARNVDIEAKKLATQQSKSLAVARDNVQQMRVHAQQIIDQFEKLRQDLEMKPLVRLHIKNGRVMRMAAPTEVESPPTTLRSEEDTQVNAVAIPAKPAPIESAHYKKAPYAPPEIGSMYSVRDKTKTERIIQVIAKSLDGTLIQVEMLEQGLPSDKPIQLSVDSLARQAEKGWCSLLLPHADNPEAKPASNSEAVATSADDTLMRIDIQNFGRCCASIVRAKLKFNTQLVKDIADGAFRIGQYDKAFFMFEQLTVGFSTAVTASHQAISEGRRKLIHDKGRLSGKEIAERTAAFVRSEQLIYAAEREFSTILEGLRMYLLRK